MNILWHSNAPYFMKTGYGEQSRVWTKALKAAGYGIVISAYRGTEGSPMMNQDGIAVLPRVKEPHCNDCIVGHVAYAPTFYPDHKATDIVWSLLDPFAMDTKVWGDLPWCPWTPIDCEPVLFQEREQLIAARWPIAMSRFGEKQMKDIGLDPIYVPHAVETNVFTPMDQQLARKNLSSKVIGRAIPDGTWLVAIVGANGIGDRKNFAGMMESFAMFSVDHPDALLYIHSEKTGVWGAPLEAMADQLDIADKVLFPPSYAMCTGLISDEMLNWVYNAADVKLMLSFGEGWGITDMEAQSAGCPCIMADNSASQELNLTGWRVSGTMRQTVPLSYQMMPSSIEACQRLTEAYDLWKAGGMPELRTRTRQESLIYDVNVVLHDYMIPALSRISADLVREPQEQWLRRKHRPAPSDKYMRRMEKKKARRV